MSNCKNAASLPEEQLSLFSPEICTSLPFKQHNSIRIKPPRARRKNKAEASEEEQLSLFEWLFDLTSEHSEIEEALSVATPEGI